MEQRRGFLYGLAAYGLWGAFPLYFPLLKPAGAGEILSQRILWTALTVGLGLVAFKGWSWLRQISRRQAGILTVAALTIAANWGVYIYAVNSGHTIEAALGYFINPLVTVVMGVLILRERLRRWQWVALTIGALAVIVLAVDYGRPPWISLVLALSFGTYGLMKKSASMGSAESMAFESAVLFVPALGATVWMQAHGTAAFGHEGVRNVVLIVLLGAVTAVPLMCFNEAARRLPLSTVGLMQYLAPVLQFLVGWVVQHEVMPASRWSGFALVWLALSLLTWDALRNAHRIRVEAQQPQREPAAA
ncbi:EamA family transporter RarD [Actinocorallia lasiicapitis]